MYLLDKSKLKMSSRRDPVIVSRAMSALVRFSQRSDLPLPLSLLFLARFYFPGDLNTISGRIQNCKERARGILNGGKRQAKYISPSLKLAAALAVVLPQLTLCFGGQLPSVVGSFWEPQAAVPLWISRGLDIWKLEGFQAGKPPAGVSSLVGETWNRHGP